jgi:hypothetical protein
MSKRKDATMTRNPTTKMNFTKEKKRNIFNVLNKRHGNSRDIRTTIMSIIMGHPLLLASKRNRLKKRDEMGGKSRLTAIQQQLGTTLLG